MIALPSGLRVWLACGHTDMRKGMDGLAMLAQQVLTEDPFSGALFAYRGKRGSLIKLLWFDGQGMCLYSKRLEKGHFVWPVTGCHSGNDVRNWRVDHFDDQYFTWSDSRRRFSVLSCSPPPPPCRTTPRR